MKTVLFMPIGLGLAHTGRLIMIAREFKKMNVNVFFGAGTDAIDMLNREKLPYIKIPEFPKEVYNNKIKNNNLFVYTRKIIETFVKSELDLFRRVKPDLIVYDARFTARISSEIAGIKSVSIINANMSPFYDFSKVKLSMDTVFANYLPQRMLNLLNKKYGQEFLRQIEPKIIKSVLTIELIKMIPSLFKLGYQIKSDSYQLFLGDWTLLTDIPEFRPVKKLPKHVKMIGPIFWDGGVKLPTWVSKIAKMKNLISVSAGGTGDKKLFTDTLKYLKDTGKTVIATTGNTLMQDDVKIKYKNLFLTDFLPVGIILPKTDLVIFPGGNATCYQALSFGVPQILMPLHLDQEDNANQLERLGTGKIINPKKEFNKINFLSAINDVLSNKEYKENALKMKKILEKHNGPKKAAEAIIDFLNQV